MRPPKITVLDAQVPVFSLEKPDMIFRCLGNFLMIPLFRNHRKKKRRAQRPTKKKIESFSPFSLWMVDE